MLGCSQQIRSIEWVRSSPGLGRIARGVINQLVNIGTRRLAAVLLQTPAAPDI